MYFGKNRLSLNSGMSIFRRHERIFVYRHGSDWVFLCAAQVLLCRTAGWASRASTIVVQCSQPRRGAERGARRRAGTTAVQCSQVAAPRTGMSEWTHMQQTGKESRKTRTRKWRWNFLGTCTSNWYRSSVCTKVALLWCLHVDSSNIEPSRTSNVMHAPQLNTVTAPFHNFTSKLCM